MNTTRREKAAIIFCATIGEYSLLIVPFIVTGMMQGYGIGENRAGDLVSLELLAMGVAGFIVSYAVRTISPRHIVAVGLFLVTAANIGCALGAHEYALFLFRAQAGIGEGAVMAASGALAANATNAHRLFSLLGLVIATVATLALIAAPALIVRLGPRTIFWLLAGVPIFGFSVIHALPRPNIANADAPRLGAFAVPGALHSLLAFGLLWVGASALWVFAERIGSYHGFSLGQIGLYLAIGQVAGILGPVISTRWGEQFGLQRSIFTGSIGYGPCGLGHGLRPLRIFIRWGRHVHVDRRDVPRTLFQIADGDSRRQRRSQCDVGAVLYFRVRYRSGHRGQPVSAAERLRPGGVAWGICLRSQRQPCFVD